MKSKGTFGYLNSSKAKLILIAVINAAFVVAIFLYGMKVYESRKNLFTIIAVLLTIPLALAITSFITFSTGKSITNEQKEELDGVSATGVRIYDLVLTVDQKLLPIACGFLTPYGTFLYAPGKRKAGELSEQQRKTAELLYATGSFRSVRLFEDWGLFMKTVKASSSNPITDEEAKQLEEQRARLTTYSV